MGGTKKKDVIENLVACCRQCHILKGDKKQDQNSKVRKSRITQIKIERNIVVLS
jgi:5-methylcytosine-specific restriction endonuclease McrA